MSQAGSHFRRIEAVEDPRSLAENAANARMRTGCKSLFAAGGQHLVPTEDVIAVATIVVQIGINDRTYSDNDRHIGSFIVAQMRTVFADNRLGVLIAS